MSLTTTRAHTGAQNLRTRLRHGGFGLIEAMVALVVLSVGMLGIAGLYVESLRTSKTALTRTAAVSLVNDMAERVRANRSARGAYALAVGTVPAAAGCVVTNNCTPAVLAQDDVARWVQTVRASLPRRIDNSSASTEILYTAGASTAVPDQYRIEVRWGEPGQTSDYTYNVIVQVIPRAAI
jgi:type IV pilus assembly protein PilV